MSQPLSIYCRAAVQMAETLSRKVGNRLSRWRSPPAAGSTANRRTVRTVVSMEALGNAFGELGITPGDAVMVHSGISQLGKVAGGPKAILELLTKQVGAQGHLLFPAFPFDNLMYEYLRHRPTFDVRTSPSKMGALTEFALKAPGSERSVHPTHSVVAFGPQRSAFVAEHHLCTAPFADGSPFARLVEFKGKILLLGVGLNSTTSFHRIEDRLGGAFPVRVYHRERFAVDCVDATGSTVQVTTSAHDPFISRIRDCDLLRPAFLREGIMREVRVGDGHATLIDAAGVDRVLEAEWRQRRLTIYGRIWG
jgi:aminoglycoside 3-N-acetyltransferase